MGERVVSDETKKKIRQLYRFLKEANQLRFRPLRTLIEQPRVVRLSDMPKHPDIQLFRPVSNNDTLEIPDTLIRVKRPKLSQCPTPPASIEAWLLPNWGDPDKDAEIAQSLNTTDAKG